jgi:hypothetical protein
MSPVSAKVGCVVVVVCLAVYALFRFQPREPDRRLAVVLAAIGSTVIVTVMVLTTAVPAVTQSGVGRTPSVSPVPSWVSSPTSGTTPTTSGTTPTAAGGEERSRQPAGPSPSNVVTQAAATHDSVPPQLGGQIVTSPSTDKGVSATRGGAACANNLPASFTINAYLTDPSGVLRPTLSYTVDGTPATITMYAATYPEYSTQATWHGTVGPFAIGAAGSSPAKLTIHLAAKDRWGNPFDRDLTYDLVRC